MQPLPSPKVDTKETIFTSPRLSFIEGNQTPTFFPIPPPHD